MKLEMIPPESLTPGMVVRSKSGMRLKVHSLSGMPDDYVILGKRLDLAGKGQNEAWPIHDLPRVRVEKV